MSSRFISCELVRLACEAYLKSRADHIAEVREPIIQSFMVPRKCLFKTYPALSREEAIKVCESMDWDSDYYMCQYRGSHWSAKVQNTLFLANAPDQSPVSIDDDMAYLLKDYWTK